MGASVALPYRLAVLLKTLALNACTTDATEDGLGDTSDVSAGRCLINGMLRCGNSNFKVRDK